MTATITADAARQIRRFDLAAKIRFEEIKHLLARRDDDRHWYDGNRTAPACIGARARQLRYGDLLATPPGIDLELLRQGGLDGLLKQAWHDAAGAEWWYGSGLGKHYGD